MESEVEKVSEMFLGILLCGDCRRDDCCGEGEGGGEEGR
jgi:hypothetical protein